MPALSIVATECRPQNDAQFNKWYNEVHIPLFMKYHGLQKAARFKKLDPDGKIPTYLAFYHYNNKKDMDALVSAPEFKAAIDEMICTWKENEFETKWAVSYEKIKEWIKNKSDSVHSAMNIVATECNPDIEKKFNEWYNNVHIPFLFKYDGLQKVIRYKKNDPKSDLPTYLAIYYYTDKEAMNGMDKSPQFEEAMNETQETWKDGGFEVKWVAPYEHITTVAK
jgi:hypothetical protein